MGEAWCWAAQSRAQCVPVSSAAPLVLTRLCGHGVVGTERLIALPVQWEPVSSREIITQSLLCGTPGEARGGGSAVGIVVPISVGSSVIT